MFFCYVRVHLFSQQKNSTWKLFCCHTAPLEVVHGKRVVLKSHLTLMSVEERQLSFPGTSYLNCVCCRGKKRSAIIYWESQTPCQALQASSNFAEYNMTLTEINTTELLTRRAGIQTCPSSLQQLCDLDRRSCFTAPGFILLSLGPQYLAYIRCSINVYPWSLV